VHAYYETIPDGNGTASRITYAMKKGMKNTIQLWAKLGKLTTIANLILGNNFLA
jgi:hypothetical protein